MISSDDIPEILRLDDLETKAWAFYAKAKARGSQHTVRRAENLLRAAHERGMADVMERVTGYF